jgi:uncharacterized protein (DUF2236 family)
MSGVAFGEYGPDSEAWRINREATALLAAAPRALLLQLAHPLVAEGVAQHSNFREDPRARLEGTLHSYMRLVYGTGDEARAEIRRLNRLHRRIKGPVRDPVAAAMGHETYDARAGDLSLWVHATLIDSTLAAYEAWIEPLSEGRAARFYEETRPIGLAFGIPDDLLPRDIGQFRAYFDAMIGPDGPIRVTPTARALAEAVLHPGLGTMLLPTRPSPPRHPAELTRAASAVLDLVPSFLFDWTLWPGVRLLPPAVREGYGIGDGPPRRMVDAWLSTSFRLWRRVLPVPFRWMPQAARAFERVGDRSNLACRAALHEE